MPDLDFEIISAEVKPFAAIPTLAFKLKITNAVEGEEVYAAALKCQVLIEATKRQYNAEAKENLREVFGEPQRWEETVKGLFWTTVTVPVARFVGSTIVDIIIASGEDHIASAGKYFYSIKDGEVPLAFLFSGTLFYASNGGNLQITQVPWHKEAAFRMPVSLWKEMMQTYFPSSRFLQIDNEVFDKLYKYKAANSFTSINDCLKNLIDEALIKKQQMVNEIS